MVCVNLFSVLLLFYWLDSKTSSYKQHKQINNSIILYREKKKIGQTAYFKIAESFASRSKSAMKIIFNMNNYLIDDKYHLKTIVIRLIPLVGCEIKKIV